MQKEEGGMKMKRKHLLCCLTVAAMLGGCGPESLEKTPQERQTQTADMAQNGKRESGTKRETSGNEGQSEREENSQFADGFGLIEEESPRVYQLAEEDPPLYRISPCQGRFGICGTAGGEILVYSGDHRLFCGGGRRGDCAEGDRS